MGLVEGPVQNFEYIRRLVVDVEDLEDTIRNLFLVGKLV
jgi:succinate dehydrogenase/fumarate reductase-like Fe-S protein